MVASIRRSRAASWGAVLLLLIFYLSRIHHLLILPTFLDEGSHITRAQEVWQGRPLYLLETGKALAPYVASLFWPFTAPIFVGRYVVVLFGLVGLAAAYAVGRELYSRQAGLLCMVLWIIAPEMMFFERMALVDTTISSMAMLTLWLAIRMVRSGCARTAAWCGLGLALCILAKTTGIIFWVFPALAAALVITRTCSRVRARQVLIAYAVGVALLTGPVIYVLSVSADPVGLSNGVVTSKTATLGERVQDHAGKMWSAEMAYYSKPMIWVILVACAFALSYATRTAVLLLIPVAALFVAVLVAASSLWLRYISPAAPFLLLITAIGMLRIVDGLRTISFPPVIRAVPWLITLAWAVLVGIPFQLTAYRDPSQLLLPEGDIVEYIQWIPSGYGIQDAAAYLEQNYGTRPVVVIGTAVNCDGARLYLPYNTPIQFICPGLDWAGDNWDVVRMIRKRAEQDGSVYVLGEDVPIVPEYLLPRPLVTLKEFPRPGANYTVTLYRVDSDFRDYGSTPAPDSSFPIPSE